MSNKNKDYKLNINKVSVIGSGIMGCGIAQLISSKGMDVVLIDISDDLLNKATSNIDKNLNRLLKKEKITDQDINSIKSRIHTSTFIQDIKDSEIVIEAVSERIDTKREVFKQVNEILNEDAIIASNTSTLPIIELAMCTDRPDKVIGIHFFNPAPVMKLVEIVNSLATSSSTTDIAHNFVVSLDKEPVITKDSPGFIVNRILFPMINEAIFVLDEGLGTAEEIDKAMKLGTNHPIGPLALADLVGLDVSLDVLDVLHNEFKDSKYRPAPLLRQMVRAGFLGRKSGKGFFDYKQ